MEEISCIYRTKDYELENKKFNSYEGFGRWVADNAMEITIVDVIQLGEGI